MAFEDNYIRFSTPNPMTAWRVDSFYEKEPDTVAWLSSLPKDAIFLDVGANVGMYSLAAAAHGCRVFAFEPESQNYALLHQNIAINEFSDKITAYCAALSDSSKLDLLFLSKFDIDGGGSCHSFSDEVGFDLSSRKSPFQQGCIGVTLDELTSSGAVPIPNYIKIDVDGFEHKVIAGAMSTLANEHVHGLIIELNTHLPEHNNVITELEKLGFFFDRNQQLRAQRKQGPFQGVGEVIFSRVTRDAFTIAFDSKPASLLTQEQAETQYKTLLDHILGRVIDTPIISDPFPHIVIDNFFPIDYFHEALKYFPHDSEMVPLSETGRASYRDRLVTLFNNEHFAHLSDTKRRFWEGFSDWLYSERFINSLIDKFWPYVARRLETLNSVDNGIKLHGDALIVSDKTNYAIGPHTDAPHRLITFLFYMPEDTRWKHLGTSIYVPKDPSFQCGGGPHHPFDLFNKTDTVSFLPNRALIFVRNNQSFHGVECITDESPERHLVINNIRINMA